MGFFKKKRKKKTARIVIAGGSGSGKTTLALQTTNSKLFAPVGYIGTEGGSDYYPHLVAEGSDAEEIADLVHAQEMVQDLCKAARMGKFPYNTVVVDSWTTLFRRFHTVYDDKKLSKKHESLSSEAQLYDEKRKSLNEWGTIKAPFTRMISNILSLPCHVIFTAWLQEEIDKYQKPTGKMFAKIDKMTEHLCSTILHLDNYKFKIQKDRSNAVKNGDKANIETLDKIIEQLEENGNFVKPSIGVQQNETSSPNETCTDCGSEVKAAVAKATQAQKGKILCLKCMKKH